MLTELKVAHCPGCGQIFQVNIRNLCTGCSSVIDRQYADIEKYMIRHRFADVNELSGATGIPVKIIQSFIRQGKIAVSFYTNLHDACDTCGGPTQSGKLCVPCKLKLKSDIYHMFESERKMKEREHFAASYKFKN